MRQLLQKQEHLLCSCPLLGQPAAAAEAWGPHPVWAELLG